jgi:large subunit ribosomal protein L7/L12
MNACRQQLRRTACSFPNHRVGALRGRIFQSFHSTSIRQEAQPQEEVATEESNNEIVWTTHRLSKDQIVKVDAIFHKVLWLDTIETALLTASINHKLNLKMSPNQRIALERQMEARAAAADGAVVTNQVEEEAEAAPQVVDLRLIGFDATAKIKVIKEVRSIAGLGLKESKELVEGAPSFIQKDLKPDKAEELKAQLEAVGAKVELVFR